MEGGSVMAIGTIINTAIAGVGSIIDAVSSDTTLMTVSMVMLAGAIGAIAFRTIKKFVH